MILDEFSFGWFPDVGELLQSDVIDPAGLMEDCLEEGIMSADHVDRPYLGIGTPATESTLLLNCA